VPAPAPAVLYQDRDVLAVDKPAGVLSVAGRGPEKADCAQARMQALFPTLYAAHRLDMATSGVLLFALRRNAERELHRQFRERIVEKQYVARVAGHVADDEGLIDLPLLATEAEGRSRVDPRGKAASTRFEVTAREPGGTSLLRLFPRTGRSHQLRVHLAHIGHPIVGDTFYAPPEVAAMGGRLQLHACELRFLQPWSKMEVVVRSAVPF
jgi:tRNA pseudouridine32 synthase/23S rRNA pseudouridine746 synthase